MKRFLLAWLLAGAALLPLPRAAAAEPVVAAADAPRQVLLLLRLPPEHYRPESGYSGGYGGGAAHGARRRVAAELAREHGLTLVTDWALPLLGVDCFVLTVPDDGRPPE